MIEDTIISLSRQLAQGDVLSDGWKKRGAMALLVEAWEWKEMGATWYGRRIYEEASWSVKAVFPMEAVPVHVLAALSAEEPGPGEIADINEWMEALPTCGYRCDGPGRPFSDGPRARLRGRRVVVSEFGGLDI